MRYFSFFPLLSSALLLALTGCLPESKNDAQPADSEPAPQPAASPQTAPAAAPTPPAAPQPDSEIQAKVRAIIAETLGVAGTSFQLADPLISGLKASELDLVDIIMLVEEAFAVTIPENAYLDAEGGTSNTFSGKDLVRIVERKTQQQQQ